MYKIRKGTNYDYNKFLNLNSIRNSILAFLNKYFICKKVSYIYKSFLNLLVYRKIKEDKFMKNINVARHRAISPQAKQQMIKFKQEMAEDFLWRNKKIEKNQK